MVQLWGDEWQIEWEVLNTKNFGIPQNRERVFVIARHTGDGCTGKIFPIGKDDKVNSKKYESKQGRSCALNSKSSRISGQSFIVASRGRESGQEIEARHDGLTNTITSVEKDNYIVHNMMPRSSKTKKGGTGHLSRKDGIVYNIDTGNTNAIEHGKSIRKLTPIEYERLQGFPDNWTKYGINEKGEKVEISDSQRYKMCGNAVSVNVISTIAERIRGNYYERKT